MRHLMFALLLICSCAHINVTAVDYTKHTMSVCGSKWASHSDLNTKAKGLCSAPKVLACWQKETGAFGVVSGYSFMSVPMYGMCCGYQCETGDNIFNGE
jgi:hypothetical protein